MFIVPPTINFRAVQSIVVEPTYHRSQTIISGFLIRDLDDADMADIKLEFDLRSSPIRNDVMLRLINSRMEVLVLPCPSNSSVPIRHCRRVPVGAFPNRP